jgi:hypothetical protein
MKRTSLESSSLKSAGYKPEAKLLEIEFLNGTVYQYKDVSPLISMEFFTAPSHGSYYNKFIRDKYEYVRIK